MTRDSQELWRTDGVFWLEDHDGDSLQGTLSVHDDGSSNLILSGAFKTCCEGFLKGEPPRFAVINGATNKYPSVCMLNPVLKQLTISGLHRSEYSSYRLIASKGLTWDLSTYPITDLLFYPQSVDCWLGISGFTIDASNDENIIVATHSLPEDLHFSVRPELSVTFSFERNGPTFSRPQKQLSLTERVVCITRTTAPSSLDDHLRYARLVTDMISLGQGKCLSFTTRSAKFAVVSQDWFGRSADLFVEIPPSPGDESGTSDSEMLFTFSDIRDRFSTILNFWFQYSEEYQATYNLYFAAARSSTIYPQHRLFNYFHALEAYHRQRYGGKLVKKKKTGSRVTTQERLLDLVMLLDCAWIFSDIDISVQRIVSLRNQQVHSGDRKTRAADPLELLNAGSALQVFCELVLLCLLGFTVDEANALLKEKGRLRRLHYRLA